MPSLMVYLALSACMTTAVGVYAGPEVWAWADDWSDEWRDRDCDRSTSAGAGLRPGGVSVGASSRSECREGSCASADEDGGRARRC